MNADQTVPIPQQALGVGLLTPPHGNPPGAGLITTPDLIPVRALNQVTLSV